MVLTNNPFVAASSAVSRLPTANWAQQAERIDVSFDPNGRFYNFAYPPLVVISY
jgi:hypothetical protein